MELQYVSTNFVNKNNGNHDRGRGNFNTQGGCGQIRNNFSFPGPGCSAGNNKPIC